MAKGVPWNNIKADYLNGVTPKELAEKYKIDINKLYKKIENDKWAVELREIKGKIGNDVQERIKELTNLALETLCEVINDPETSSRDKVSASKAILDVSGLKTLKQEVSGVGGYSVIINREAVEVECDKL
jgi:replicative superfamily II helicase